MNLRSHVQQLLNSEEHAGVCTSASSQSQYRKSNKFALVYPSTYQLGMSSLGIQVIHATLNKRKDTSCERVFIPETEYVAELIKKNTPLFSMETQKPLNAFDIIGFSISFESDYINVPRALTLGNIPPLAEDRTEWDPLVIAGGINISYNPEPLADFIDIFVVGEAEHTIHQLMDDFQEWRLSKSSKQEFLREIGAKIGFYVPSFYDVTYQEDGKVKQVLPKQGIPANITASAVPQLDSVPTCTHIHTPNTEFSNAHLIEIVRGCGRQCRFCVADYARRWPRHRSVENTLALAEKARGITDRIGLVGASISDHPQINQIASGLVDRGFRISCASLRAETVEAPLLDALADSEQGTITIAPEVATENLQKVVNKAIPRERLYYIFEEALKRNILNLRLYFLIGVPYETPSDVTAIAEMAKEMRTILLPHAKRTGKIGRISFTISPMVPKPHTPFQWVPMEPPKTIAKKLDYLKREINRLGSIKVSSASARMAHQEAVMARGDRRLGRVILDLSRGVTWNNAFRSHGLTPDFYALRQREFNEINPWDHLDLNVKPQFLQLEFNKHEKGFMTSACDTTVCKKCGAC